MMEEVAMKRVALLVGACCLLVFPISSQGGKATKPGMPPDKDKPKMEAPDTAWLLDEVMPFNLDGQVSLSEVVRMLSSFAQEMLPDYRVVVDEAAFKAIDADGILDTPVTFRPSNAKRLPVREVLHLALKQLPIKGATYLVRPGIIEITTPEAAQPERQVVHGKFVKVPLAEALDRLSAQAGISIVVDAKAEEKARALVSAHFRSSVNLMTAVDLLADSAGLKSVVVETVLYVTLPSNKAEFPRLRAEPGA
jgi:hypothetical protein